MSFVEIYQNGIKIGTESPKRNFYIVEDPTSGEIFWDADPGPIARPGAIRIWVQTIDTNPQIAFVLPEWQLSINEIPLEPKLHDSVEDLKGKLVELRHEGYRFLFHFSP
jgi:hypothetical protein